MIRCLFFRSSPANPCTRGHATSHLLHKAALLGNREKLLTSNTHSLKKATPSWALPFVKETGPAL